MRNWLKGSSKETAFVGDMAAVYKITKELVNTNTNTDPAKLDLNENILSTDEAYHKLRPINRK